MTATFTDPFTNRKQKAGSLFGNRPLALVAGQDLNLRPLGYEPYDVHPCRLVRSPVAAVTLAYGWRMFASRSVRLRCVAALWRVSCTDSCTHLVLGHSASGCGAPPLVQGRSCRVPRRQ